MQKSPIKETIFWKRDLNLIDPTHCNHPVVEYSDLLAEHRAVLLECTALVDCAHMGGVSKEAVLFLCSCHDFCPCWRGLAECKALLAECRALLAECRALLAECKALEGAFGRM